MTDTGAPMTQMPPTNSAVAAALRARGVETTEPAIVDKEFKMPCYPQDDKDNESDDECSMPETVLSRVEGDDTSQMSSPIAKKAQGGKGRASLALGGGMAVAVTGVGAGGKRRASCLAAAPVDTPPEKPVGALGALRRASLSAAGAVGTMVTERRFSRNSRMSGEEKDMMKADEEEEERHLIAAMDAGNFERDELATQHAALSFKNIAFHVRATDPDDPAGKRKIQKPILENAWGHFDPGTLVALMGPSGCGKSTLMDIIAQKKTSHYSGDVYMNGRVLDNMYHRVTSYVSQQDIMPPHWTVLEAVTFDAKLKKPMNKGMSNANFEMYVCSVLEDVGLLHVKDTKVGNESVRGISGGQKRRVTLARGIVSKAALMFCDEPTSGLSATDAELCVKTLLGIARRWNVTILVVIHQPRIEVAQLFDHLLLLTSRPGRIVYNGPMKEAAAHWEKAGYPVPPSVNPTDYFLDTVSPGLPGADPDHFVNFYNENVLPDMMEKVKNAVCTLTPGMTAMQLLEEERTMMLQFGDLPPIKRTLFGTSWMTQFWALSKRKLDLLRKDPVMLAILFLSKLVMGVVYGVIMQGIGNVEPKGIAQVPFFFTALQQVAVQSMYVLPVLFEERMIMKIEKLNSLYSTSAYVISTSIIDVFLSVLGTVPQLAILYAFAAMDWAMFHEFLIWCVVASLGMEAILLSLGAAVQTMAQAQAATMPVMTVPILFSGLLVSRNSCPDFLKWLLDLSPLNYAMEYLTLRFYGEGCEDITMAALMKFNSTADQSCVPYASIKEMFGHSQPKMSTLIGINVGCFVVFRALQAVALAKLNNVQK